MFARFPLVLLLLASLLFAGFPVPQARGVVHEEAGECMDAMCLMACCPMKACCEGGQPQAPSAPESLAPRPDVQLIAPTLQVFAGLHERTMRTWHFVTVDEKSGGHAPPPLARSCIQLI